VKSLVEFLAKALVDKTEAIEVNVTPSEGGFLYELKVAPDEAGKIIGREGRTINALRTIVQHAAEKKGHNARLEIFDERGTRSPNGGSVSHSSSST
jgi:uncharacterized protein